MRLGVTQSTPTAHPLVMVKIGTDTYTSQGAGGSERIVSVKADEQVWGGLYEILLDNSDNALTLKQYATRKLILSFGFLGQPLTDCYGLYIFKQSEASFEGKLLTKLICIDGWGILAQAKTTFANWYFNQEWQKEENIDEYTMPSGDPIPEPLRQTLINNSDVPLYTIASRIISSAIGHTVWPPYGFDILKSKDFSLVRKPPISFANAISGVRQALEMADSYFLWKATIEGHSFDTGVFYWKHPPSEAVCYQYNHSDLFFSNVKDQGAVIPNAIYFWSFNAAGDAWIEGNAKDSESIALLGHEIARHYILAPDLQVDSRSDVDTLTDVAEGTLKKIQQEREQGIIVAPMHCSQELFDRVEVKDTRYSPDRIITGVVHRIVREYDRGKYQITLQLGGITSGVTGDMGGNVAVPLHEANPPRAPILVGDVTDTKHLHITAAYSIPMTEVNLAYNVSDPGEALLAGEDLVIPVPTIGVASAQTTVAMPSDVYIHDGVNLIDTGVTAENNDDLQTYQACPTDPSLGDGLYVCHTAKFDCIQFYISTAGEGTYTFRASYFNGTAWVAIPSFYADGDDTGSFKVTGYRWVQFIRPADWALFEVDSKDRYILHMEINFEGTMTTVPLLRTAVLGIW